MVFGEGVDFGQNGIITSHLFIVYHVSFFFAAQKNCNTVDRRTNISFFFLFVFHSNFDYQISSYAGIRVEISGLKL